MSIRFPTSPVSRLVARHQGDVYATYQQKTTPIAD